MLRFVVLILASWLVSPVRGGEVSSRQNLTPEGSSPFSAAWMDPSLDPCSDFYQYACGGWLKTHEIPSDRASWGRASELSERNLRVLREILEQASDSSRARDPISQKIGDFFSACMDEKTIDSKGLAPLEPVLSEINSLRDKSQLGIQVARLHGRGVDALFSFDSDVDAKDSSRMIAEVDEGGLGLPDREYYLKTDPESRRTRDLYVRHVGTMLRLLGKDARTADRDAGAVLKIETELARISLSRTQRRDPDKVYHKTDRKVFEGLAPALEWTGYFAARGGPEFSSLNVTEPGYFSALNPILRRFDLGAWKAYLRWHAVHAYIPMLPKKFIEENFDFYGRVLSGQKEIKARWKRCVDQADEALGEAVGEAYVRKTFSPTSKERVLKMVAALEEAMGRDIRESPWMAPQTKEKALQKLKGMENKIGYPDAWRDYSSVRIDRDDALGNSRRATEFEIKRRLDKIGKPVDKKEWEMLPQTVNAYNRLEMNNIVFPAGILQPPFFEASADDAVNLGAIGAVIGHELTHGFDDEGRKFDAQGTLKDWWTSADALEYEKRSACFAEQYSSYTVAGGARLNGELSLGENTADNGGLRLALLALISGEEGKKGRSIAGFSPVQRLFLSFGQAACGQWTPELERMLAVADPHPPDRIRVNGVVSNMPEFMEAFRCKPGAPMARVQACRVW